MRRRRENNKNEEEEEGKQWKMRRRRTRENNKNEEEEEEEGIKKLRNLPAKNQWTGTRTITAAGNRKCIITLRLSDFKSQTSLTLILRHYELTNENVSSFLTNQSKRKTSIDIKVTRKPILRHYELTNENVSNFLTNQSKTKTFIDLKVTSENN